MGNIQPIIDNMYENEKLEFLITQGLINDELIQLFRNGTMTSKDIQNYVIESIKINKNHK